MKKAIFIVVVLIVFSCKKDELGPQCINCEGDEIANTNSTSVLIVNEGNFGFGNGALHVYNDSTQFTAKNVFQQKNSLPLGDVVQSAYQINGKAYIVVNNSNKIEVADINNFNSLATIAGFNSPRYFLPININTAYVTDLYSNSIQVVDLSSNSISGNIPLSGWTEELLLFNDSVYVCDMTNDNLLIINPLNNTLIDSVKLGESPNSIVIDNNNKLWILCSGGFNSTPPKLIKFNPQSRLIEETFVFANISKSPNSLKINKAGDQMYFINSNIYTMNISEKTLPTTPLITSNSNTFYGLGVNPNNNDIYVSDAIDFIQNGKIFRYSSSGVIIHQFNAGIIPGSFLFIK